MCCYWWFRILANRVKVCFQTAWPMIEPSKDLKYFCWVCGKPWPDVTAFKSYKLNKTSINWSKIHLICILPAGKSSIGILLTFIIIHCCQCFGRTHRDVGSITIGWGDPLNPSYKGHTVDGSEIRRNPPVIYETLWNIWIILNINWLAGFLNHQQYVCP